MSRSRPISRISRRAAFSCAAALLVLSGVGFRWLESILAGGYRNNISSNTLTKIPITIAGFSGRDIPLDERVRLASNAESVIYRLYGSNNGIFEFSLFVTAGGRPRDLAPHRPEVCYASAGWLRESAVATRIGSGLSAFDARFLRFGQAGMPPKRTVVLNYYLVDGEAFADIDGLRLRVARVGKEIRCWTQVQVATMLEPGESEESAKLALSAFAALVAPEILRATGFGPIMPIEEAKEPRSP